MCVYIYTYIHIYTRTYINSHVQMQRALNIFHGHCVNACVQSGWMYIYTRTHTRIMYAYTHLVIDIRVYTPFFTYADNWSPEYIMVFADMGTSGGDGCINQAEFLVYEPDTTAGMCTNTHLNIYTYMYTFVLASHVYIYIYKHIY